MANLMEIESKLMMVIGNMTILGENIRREPSIPVVPVSVHTIM